MFTAIATKNGWEVSREGKTGVVATFEKLETVKATIAKMNGKLTVVINGYQVN